MANDALFIEVLAHIEAEPDSWQQSYYRCDTGMCFAGWAAELSGYRWAADAESELSDFVIDGGKRRPVWEVATELLTGAPYVGDDGQDELELFESGNDLDDLYHLSAQLMGVEETELRDKVAVVLLAKVATSLTRA